MNGSFENSMVWLVGLMAALLLGQTILLGVLVVTVRNWTIRMGVLSENFSKQTAPLLQTSRDVIFESRQRISSIMENLDQISNISRKQVERLDGILGETTQRAQVQVEKLDHLVSDTMARVEATSEAIQKGVLTPVQEVSAIISGIRATMEFLTHRSKKTIDRAIHDEELFI